MKKTKPKNDKDADRIANARIKGWSHIRYTRGGDLVGLRPIPKWTAVMPRT